MDFNFFKYHSSGNDFILIENYDETFPSHDVQYIKSLCHRWYGIGADGLILLENTLDADVFMHIFNSDGIEAGMCGNALCVTSKHLIQNHNQLLIQTISGLYKTKYESGHIWAQMHEPQLKKVVPIQLSNISIESPIIDSGVKHLLIKCDAIPQDLDKLAKPLRDEYDANVSFYCMSNNRTEIRTFEKGVEGQTRSCGTAATALFYWLGIKKAHFFYKQDEVFLKKIEGNIFYSGNIKFVFDGKIEKKAVKNRLLFKY